MAPERTAAGRSAAERVVVGPCTSWPEDSAFIREVLDRIGDKWTVLVLSTLGDRALRYSDLQASIPGISQRMLTVTVKALERDGLVVRQAYAEMPPRVEYEVTELGRSLQRAVLQLAGWAAENHQTVAANRSASDRIGIGRARKRLDRQTR
ncbi:MULTISPECIES: winged helix-turn-helix transcriptional regulator [Curtobacterium]|uniref:winged helix-turn-helix transcriptional regulator n=1 Tax=Curtobacterium flaccumfaciens TaxID=2035 RepID=UPI003EE46A7D